MHVDAQGISCGQSYHEVIFGQDQLEGIHAYCGKSNELHTVTS